MDTQEILAGLRHYFGHSSFRNAQQEVVERLLAGEDLCVVMPTGAGKSLCYQLPVMLKPGYGLVISPLISLMKDQVDSLNAKGLHSVCINSFLTVRQQQECMDKIYRGEAKFLYVAPERFRVSAFRSLLSALPPSMVIIDEAHCISQWGHDFRPDYQTVWKNSPELSALQFAAFTATATPLVREDIHVQLGRPDMQDIVSGFKRPNLSFSVLPCNNDMDKDRYLSSILEKDRVPTIIYTATRKDTDGLASRFGITPYHAGMNEADRHAAQDYFMRDSCPVLTATNAFGMGIDRQDIRRVIHYSLPQSLEAYYQEAGRAGRDGKPAECVVLFSYKDLKVREFIIDHNRPSLLMLQDLLTKLRSHYDRFPNSPLFLEDLLSDFGPENERQLQGGIRLLELQGLAQRTQAYRNDLGRLSFLLPLDAPSLHPGGPPTQRGLFLNRLSTYFLTNNISSLTIGIEQLAFLAGLRADLIPRVLEALDGSFISWTPSNAGGEAIFITEKGRAPDAAIDTKDMLEKQHLDDERLNAVKRYCTMDAGCRQAAIIRYFGEKIQGWKCGLCDNCRNTGSASAKKGDSYETLILEAVSHFDGQFGKGRIVGMLQGTEDSNKNLMNSSYFGKLSKVPSKVLFAIIARLLDDGRLEILNHGIYPCLAIGSEN